MKFVFIIFFFLFCGSACFAQTNPITIASKNFTESYILAELISRQIKDNFPNQKIELKPGMGGTGLLFEALKKEDIDIYPEYTGTIAEAILKDPELKTTYAINKALLPLGLTIGKPLGFNNTYAFAVKKKTAERYALETISDLKDFPELRFGFSYEFLERLDGYYALADRYQLTHTDVHGMQHSLAYEAIASDKVDLIDVYSTDSKIEKMGFKILKDDLDFFPRYNAVILANVKFVKRYPQIWKNLKSLENKISEAEIIKLNALVELENYSFKQAASSFFEVTTGPGDKQPIEYNKIWVKTKEHIVLVFISLLFSILIGVPLGYLATCSSLLRQSVFAVSGAIQTIPSLALLCFFVPFLGIGTTTALTALVLYGLLPIVRNTCTGIESIDKKLMETCQILGLDRKQSMFWVELPLAMPTILSGIKTSAVINVGTATLAAFIGCGGFGSFIVTGLALNDMNVILHGAVPSALFALILQGMFDIVDRFMVPKGIRVS